MMLSSLRFSFHFLNFFILKLRKGGEPFSENAGFQGPLQLKHKYIVEKKIIENLNTKVTFKNKTTTFNIKKMKTNKN